MYLFIYAELIICRNYYMQKSLYAEIIICRNHYMQKSLYAEIIICRNHYMQKLSSVLMFSVLIIECTYFPIPGNILLQNNPLYISCNLYVYEALSLLKQRNWIVNQLIGIQLILRNLHC